MVGICDEDNRELVEQPNVAVQLFYCPLNKKINLFKCLQLFDKLRRDAPNELLKVIAVPGDITEHELGISESDQNVLIRNVSVVFHSAATVKFDEALKISVTINMVGTKQLLNLCHRMQNLEVKNMYTVVYYNINALTFHSYVWRNNSFCFSIPEQLLLIIMLVWHI